MSVHVKMTNFRLIFLKSEIILMITTVVSSFYLLQRLTQALINQHLREN